tara:strand:+ start:1278 stop:1586 length:309 start_codon:yes stop_codon:yes gene_type:complete
MLKKITYILLLFIFLNSCGGTFDSVKRGLTGEKKNSADEFLVKKKDPLILPPDFESLPSPDSESILEDERSIFEKTLEATDEENSTSSRSTETSILKKIKSK